MPEIINLKINADLITSSFEWAFYDFCSKWDKIPTQLRVNPIGKDYADEVLESVTNARHGYLTMVLILDEELDLDGWMLGDGERFIESKGV
jgi:hypothetical protein